MFFSRYESRYPYSPDGAPPWSGDTGIYDPLFVCAVAAEATRQLRVGTAVLILPQRPALLTAKEALTLDHLSQGRFRLGAGAGWAAEEYAALGVSFARRGRRFDEYVQAIRAAWTTGHASFHGEFVNFDDVVLLPKPHTPGGPPILIGGDTPDSVIARVNEARRCGVAELVLGVPISARNLDRDLATWAAALGLKN